MSGRETSKRPVPLPERETHAFIDGASGGSRGQGGAYRFHSLKSKYREEYAEFAAEARGQEELL